MNGGPKTAVCPSHSFLCRQDAKSLITAPCSLSTVHCLVHHVDRVLRNRVERGH
jgi:hypothetical protein